MNTEPETAPAPEIPPLPQGSSTTRKLTFAVPHILKSLTLDEGGFIHREVREGGPRQIDFETVHEYSETPVENEPLFVVRATNQLNFAGSIINVLNDEIKLDNGFQLVPTSPTATEYLAKVGQRVQVASMCNKDQPLSDIRGKDTYKVARIFIVLP